jgi:hypothetical protein
LIVVRILGGLGNQFFQYATARALADAAGVPLYLDCRGFSDYALRDFTLGKYAIRADIANAAVLRRFPEWQRKLGRRLPWRAGRHGRWVFEKDMRYLPDLTAQRGELYLDGYFQWEPYFRGHADAIRTDLTLKTGVTPETREMEAGMLASPTVAIHVRRGDYVNNAINQRIFGSCSEQYYRQALAAVRQRAGEVRPVVFSDDAGFARRMFADIKDALFISGDRRDPTEDLYLMSACHHHIIANSSFSWWGAWLGKKPGQVVVAPKPWFDLPAFAGIDIEAEGRIYVPKNPEAPAKEELP